MTLQLGTDRNTQESIQLDSKYLLRHVFAVGSSGSGKTVLCKVIVEEAVRQGLPVICVDPQGDLCSLALAADNPELLAAKGLDPALARQFAEASEVVVFTPAARKGVPLSADPIQGEVDELPAAEQIYAISGMAAVLTGLLDYKLDSNEGKGVAAVFELMLTDMREAGIFPVDLAAFTSYFSALDDAQTERYSRLVKTTVLANAQRQLARLDVGARRLLFHEGLGLDIDLLLGRGDNSAAQPGKTRIAVIYLNTLASQADKEFFVAALADRLYRWMLKHPSKTPQALFYIDEVAPFMPPVRVPACKQGLSLVFKQARKYGVCCLMATQNPGDVDYKALAQFGTWALGRLSTAQDLKKIDNALRSLAPQQVDDIRAALPSLQAGQFFLLAPDAFDYPRALQTRWLYSQHETLNEARIEALYAERWRHFEALATPQPSSDALELPTPTEVALAATPEAGELAHEIPAESQMWVRQLARSCSMSPQEFADLTGLSEAKARATLKTLVAEDLAGSYKESRSLRYWAKHTGLRPDLGWCRKVNALIPLISSTQAEAIAHDSKSQKILGFLGNDERVGQVVQEYQVCLRLRFRETAAKGWLGQWLRSKETAEHSRRLSWSQKLRRAVWQGVTSGLYEERADSIYLHPQTLHILTFDLADGIRLTQRPAEQASDIVDFDSVAMEERLPAELHFDARDWQDRRPDEVVKKQFKAAYDASPQSIEPCLIPVWRLHLHHADNSETRLITIDALSGQVLRW